MGFYLQTAFTYSESLFNCASICFPITVPTEIYSGKSLSVKDKDANRRPKGNSKPFRKVWPIVHYFLKASSSAACPHLQTVSWMLSVMNSWLREWGRNRTCGGVRSQQLPQSLSFPFPNGQRLYLVRSLCWFGNIVSMTNWNERPNISI